MDILYLSCLYSEDKIATYQKNSVRGVQFAAQNLQESILDGFDQNEQSVTVLTIPSLSTFPRSYKKPIVPSAKYKFHTRERGVSIGFVNLPFFRPLLSNPKHFVEDWYNNSMPGDRHIFVYGLHTRIMEIAIWAKKKYCDICITIIIPDLPQYFGWNKYYRFLGVDKRRTKHLKDLVKKFDKYVVLSKYMIDDLELPDDNQAIVMEGIFSPESTAPINKIEKKTILYTGNAAPRYGLAKLVKAFGMIDSDDYRLLIRGNGMDESLVEEIKKDPRVSLVPSMSKKTLIELEQNSTLLVNPVPASQEFTKYFFPSKTMDYLASGTPTLMYDLECLPSEYREHLVLLKDESIEALRDKIVEVCSWTPEYSRDKGEKARNFILTMKNAKCQVGKIIDLMESV